MLGSEDITILVGGKEFKTSRSLANGMLDLAMRAIDTSSLFFFDRDPEHFPVILNFLRTGDVFFQSMDSTYLLELFTEARFYKQEKLAARVKAVMQWQRGHGAMSDGVVVDLAAGRPAFASSVEVRPGHSCPTWSDTLHAHFATDVAVDTRWASALDQTLQVGRTRIRSGKDGEWLCVDLGEPCSVEAVSVLWELAFARCYMIQLSASTSDTPPLAEEAWATAAREEIRQAR
eukprot:Rmarinus@m.7849